jgi:hypothetical protein
MLEAFKLGYAAGLGVVAAMITGLAVLGAWDWLGGVIARLRLVLHYWHQDRRPTR